MVRPQLIPHIDRARPDRQVERELGLTDNVAQDGEKQQLHNHGCILSRAVRSHPSPDRWHNPRVVSGKKEPVGKPPASEGCGRARFDRTMTLVEALQVHPKARWVFAAYHLSGCIGCRWSGEETIEQVAVAYRLPLEKLIADLNSLS
jgi:hybrid cluster-associated redox disulfide protein